MLAGLVIGCLAGVLPFTPAAVGTLLVIGGWTWFAVSSFKNGLWLDMTQPLGTMAIALFWDRLWVPFEGRSES